MSPVFSEMISTMALQLQGVSDPSVNVTPVRQARNTAQLLTKAVLSEKVCCCDT